MHACSEWPPLPPVPPPTHIMCSTLHVLLIVLCTRVYVCDMQTARLTKVRQASTLTCTTAIHASSKHPCIGCCTFCLACRQKVVHGACLVPAGRHERRRGLVAGPAAPGAEPCLFTLFGGGASAGLALCQGRRGSLHPYLHAVALCIAIIISSIGSIGCGDM